MHFFKVSAISLTALALGEGASEALNVEYLGALQTAGHPGHCSGVSLFETKCFQPAQPQEERGQHKVFTCPSVVTWGAVCAGTGVSACPVLLE